MLQATAAPQLQPLKELPSEAIPSALLMLVTTPSQESLRIANLVFEGRYKFAPALKEINFPGGKIDWDVNTGSAQNTYHLWLHSLNTVSYLCNAHEMTGDKKYLQKAHAILQDWVAYAKSKGGNKFLWYDHSVANRMITLTYFYQLGRKQGLWLDEEQRRHVSLLYEHAAFLANPKNYSQYNHGVMMDKSLLLASLFLRRSYPKAAKGWFDLALTRIRVAFERDFTPAMVHVENSPAYHFYVSEHFAQMTALMKHFQIEPPTGIVQKLALGEEFARCVTMPNRHVPMVGDTGPMLSPVPSSLTSKVFPDAGVMIACSPTPKQADSTWLLFKSGYLTHTHKHADDLSFLLYTREREVFIDGGLLNYDPENPFARHLRSALAHNTLVVDGQSYEIRRRALDGSDPPPWTLFEESGLIASKTGAACDMARGYNAAYPGVELERTVVFLKPDLVIIHDIAKSNRSHQYTQIFRPGGDLRIARLGRDALILGDAQDQFTIALVQLMAEMVEMRWYHGDKETIRGWGARQFDQLLPVPQVEFTKKGKKAEFLTMIGLGQSEGEVHKLAGRIISVKPDHVVIRPPNGDAISVARGPTREPRAR
jgi:hypothetical protein